MVAIERVSLVHNLRVFYSHHGHVLAQVNAIHHQAQPGRHQPLFPVLGGLTIEHALLDKQVRLHPATRAGIAERAIDHSPSRRAHQGEARQQESIP